MFRFRNILVPVDFSEPSANALACAVSLARCFNARIVAVHVIPPTVDEVYDRALSRIEELREVTDRTYSFRSEIRTGDTQAELLKVIDEEAIDLVVMGTHGRGLVERVFLGSTTEHLLRKSPVPILTVCHVHAPDTGPIHSIVYATDLSANSESGLEYAGKLARALNARLDVLHVIDLVETGTWGGEAPGAMSFDLAAVEEHSRSQMKESLKHAACDDLHAETFVREGVTPGTIVQFAEERHAGLLILNLQNKTLVERVMLGATAERVIRKCHVPVLSLPNLSPSSALVTEQTTSRV